MTAKELIKELDKQMDSIYKHYIEGFNQISHANYIHYDKVGEYKGKKIIRLYNSGLCDLTGLRIWKGEDFYIIEELNRNCLKLEVPENLTLVAEIDFNDDEFIYLREGAANEDEEFVKLYFSVSEKDILHLPF